MMIEFAVETKAKSKAIDVTAEVKAIVERENWGDGLLLVQVPHTTCAVFVNEFEPNIAGDYERMFKELDGKKWAHNDVDDNAEAHLKTAAIGHQRMVPIEGGKMALGQWQKIVLMEFDGPRTRKVQLKFLGSER